MLQDVARFAHSEARAEHGFSLDFEEEEDAAGREAREREIAEREYAVRDWCNTVAQNGAYPGGVFAFADKRKFWPRDRKPGLAECRPYFKTHYLGLTAADLKRGYLGDD